LSTSPLHPGALKDSLSDASSLIVLMMLPGIQFKYSARIFSGNKAGTQMPGITPQFFSPP